MLTTVTVTPQHEESHAVLVEVPAVGVEADVSLAIQSSENKSWRAYLTRDEALHVASLLQTAALSVPVQKPRSIEPGGTSDPD